MGLKKKMCEVMQSCEHLGLSVQEIINILESKKNIKDWAFIKHDKDVDTKEHFHIAIRFNNAQDFDYVAKWFGIDPQFVETVKGKWQDILKYLTHENAPEKHQYDIKEVLCNFDYEQAKISGDGRREEIINKIVNGEIREYNYFEHISVVEYDKYKKSIDNAFRYRIDKIKGVGRNMDCVFITGDSGTGKTSYAKKIAEEKKYSVFISSGSNDPLDDYKGQDCIILDDLRPSCMGLSDLLKMLDNHTASTVKSRYKNKVLECKMIIITTTLDIDNFFNNVFSEEKETIIQLKRRCSVMLKFEMDYYHNYFYQDSIRDYVYIGKLPNPITLERKMEAMDREGQLNKLAEILGLSRDLVENIRDNYLEEVDGEQIEW